MIGYNSRNRTRDKHYIEKNIQLYQESRNKDAQRNSS